MALFLKNASSNIKAPKILTLLERYKGSTKSVTEFDFVIIGGGILGVATARELLLRDPSRHIAIVEKESSLALHQTGRNSGVIHAGIYYTPGSLKAKLCVKGSELMYQYCDSKKIPYKKIGKLIVATNPIEQERLQELIKRAELNKVKGFKVLKGQKEITDIEPHCHGLEALYSPNTGIVDFKRVTESFGEDFTCQGGNIIYNFEVKGFKPSKSLDFPVEIINQKKNTIKAKFVFSCAGLYSDIVAELSGCKRQPRILPVRGEYLLLKPEKNYLVKGNIYPVPDPTLPFLGVHFTPRMDGSIWLGPNAVMAFRREGYSWLSFKLREFIDAISYPGLWHLLYKHPLYATKEVLKSLIIPLQMKGIQNYVPEISYKDVLPGPCGVRAQALDLKGQLVDDFYFDKAEGEFGNRILHCRNAPSPGATSSLAIAEMMADTVEKEFLQKKQKNC